MKLAPSAILVLAVAAAAKPQVKAPGDLSKVKFYLYTRANPDLPDDIPFEFGDLGWTNYDSGKKTYFLVHGWTSDISFAEPFLRELLSEVDCNIFGVDWGELASWTNYFEAAENAMDVGTHIGEFTIRLIMQTGLSHSKIHAVGHSLGGQALGHLGRTVTAATGTKVARLSVLDPARPYFEVLDPSLWVNKNDGAFVDVIHTNSGALWDGCLSFIQQMGHIDFYPNGGDHQPGCTEICAPGCTENDLVDLIKGGCSHGRSVDYFIESIKGSHTKFMAKECADWETYPNCGIGSRTAEMGFHLTSSPKEAQYYLGVNEETPFAQG